MGIGSLAWYLNCVSERRVLASENQWKPLLRGQLSSVLVKLPLLGYIVVTIPFVCKPLYSKSLEHFLKHYLNKFQ